MNFGGLISWFGRVFSAPYSEVKISDMFGHLAHFCTDLISSSSSVVPHSRFYGHWPQKPPGFANKQFQQAVKSFSGGRGTASVRIALRFSKQCLWMKLSEWTRSGGARGEHAAVTVSCVMGTSIASSKVSGGVSPCNSAFFLSGCVSVRTQSLFQEDCILLILIL